MLITFTAVLAAVFALRVASLGPAPPSTNDGIALLWSLLTCPELDILLQSTAPIILSLIVTNLGIKGPKLLGLSKSSQNISPIPLLDLLRGPYCKSLDLFKPIVSPAVRFNTAHSLDTLDHLTASVSPNAWNRPSPTLNPTESLETMGLHYVRVIQQDESSNAPAAGFTGAMGLDISTTSTSASTVSNNSSVNPIHPFTLSSLTIAATCVFLAVSTTLAVLVVLSVIIVNWAENEAAIPLSPLAVHQLHNSGTIRTPKSDTFPSIKLQVSRSESDTIRPEAPLYHVPAPADSNVSREIPFGELQKPTKFIQEVISADGSVDVPVFVPVNTRHLEVADFNHGATMSPPLTSKLTFTEADRQMNFSPPRELSVAADNISANAPMHLHTRTIPPGRLCQWQQTPTPTHPAEASGCTVEPEITDCGNASPPSPDLDQREQSVADSMWANAPVPPPSPRTRRTPQQQPLSVCQRQHIPTTTPFEACDCTAPTELIDCGNLPPSPSDLGQCEQSVADSMWANAPMPPSPRTRRAPHQQPLSICQRQHTPTSTSIEAFGCTVRDEREQSVADSMWANAPMPPLSPRTRRAPSKRSSSIFQRKRTTSIESSGCTARTEIIDRGNLPSPPPDLEHEESVADSMWANAPMPPSPTRTASRHYQRPQNSGAFNGNTAKLASSAVHKVERRTTSSARNE